MIDDPEEFAWQELERKQQKKKQVPVTEREALKIACNALIEIDKETPYPLAKHAAMVINSVLSVSATDWEAVAADQAMTIALMKTEQWDTSDMAHRPNGLTVEPPDYVEPVTYDYHEGWEEGFKVGNALVPPKRDWVGLTDEEITEYSSWLSGRNVVRAIEQRLKEKNT